jgi:NAD-dependent dihydropyrimidine dehydrogenase PreA subunit
MAVRKVVHIDQELCDGCGVCVPSCHEGALQIVDGKAKLLGDNLCDGLGDCLGECPQDAITVKERDADDFDEGAVKLHLAQRENDEAAGAATTKPNHTIGHGGGCPGSKVLQFTNSAESAAVSREPCSQPTELRQWPVQLHLLPPTAPFLQGADVLLAADCTAYAIGDFHDKHLRGRSLAIACPKLDQGMESYLSKLVAMIDQAKINTLSVMIMEVPCCGGLVHLAKEAASKASRKIPIRQLVVGVRGDIISDEWA